MNCKDTIFHDPVSIQLLRLLYIFIIIHLCPLDAYLCILEPVLKVIDLSLSLSYRLYDVIQTVLQFDFTLHIASNELVQSDGPISILVHLLKQK